MTQTPTNQSQRVDQPLVDELPEGWTLARLNEVAAVNMGQSPPGKSYNEEGEGLPFFQGKADFGERYPKVRVWCTEPKKIANPGDVLLSVRAPVGPTNVADRKCIIGRGLTGLTPCGGIPTEFVLFALRLLEPELSMSGTGSTFAAISKKDIDNIEVSLPPLAEQKRIVEKVEQLLARVNAARERLARVPAILKRFRQSVLAAACSGRLTADWRVNAWLNLAGTGTVDFILGGRKLGNHASDPKVQRDFDFKGIPDTWRVALLSEIADSRLGKMLDKKKNVGSPTKYLRNVNVRWFGFNLDDLLEIRATKEDREKLNLNSGDVLICEGGEPGRAAVWENGSEGLIFQKALHRIRLKAAVQPKWLVYNLKVDADSMRIDALFTGTTIKHLTGKSIAKYPLAVPPVEEQHEIIRRVEALFRKADEVEAHYERARVQADKLTQSVLSKAFRGELVPTEAELARREGREYEPASMLLERIKAEREAQEVKKGPQKPRASRKKPPKRETKATEEESEHRASVSSAREATKRAFTAKIQKAGEKGKPVSISELETDEVMAVFRKACRGRGAMSRDELLKEASVVLGCQRMGGSVQERLKGHLRAAILRGIIESGGDLVRPLTRTIDEYAPDFLIDTLRSVMRSDQHYKREEVVRAAAQHLGFSRVTQQIDTILRKAISTAIRRGDLVSDRDTIWRI